ncbi:MAG TPA: hypothetical protein VGE40_10175, partial [Bacilli bacterium]
MEQHKFYADGRPAETVSIHADGVSHPDIERIISIMKRRMEERCTLLKVMDRNGAIDISLSVQRGLGEEGFRIEDGTRGFIRITGNDRRGLLYGVGKFLHTSIYTHEGFIPSSWRGVSVPRGMVRGMYLASHFFNWYHVAPEVEVIRYLEDLALWGVNAIALVFPVINLFGWDDPETGKSIDQLKKMYKAAKKLHLDVGMVVVPNQDFKSPKEQFKAVPNPDPLGRRGNHGNNICPNIPGAGEYILGNMAEMFNRFKDIELDYLCVWPYDEGGCACDPCFPWGANGFLKISRDVVETARTVFPNIKVIVSTWMFDTPIEEEWAGLSKALKEQSGWVDSILADSHEDFPPYPLKHGVPGNLPLLNFPEISMWGLSPWGGYGANPLPKRFQALWNQVKHVVTGGFPYSEGIYEDINKVVISRFYWDADYTEEQT